MAERRSLLLWLCPALVLTCWHFLPGIAFIAPRRSPADVQKLAAAVVEGASAQSSSSFSSSSAQSSSSGMLWWSVMGLSLVGASLKVNRRKADTACYARRRIAFKHQFGGEGAPKPPSWLVTPRDTEKPGHKVPAWLTLQKWETFNAADKCRGTRWYIQTHDENGNLCYDKQATYTIPQAVDLLLEMNAKAPLNFDASLECHMTLNLNPKYPDQILRTSISLPHGTGKQVRVAVFCSRDEEEEVKAAGADRYGVQLAQDIAAERLDFDVLLAKPQMMPQLAKLGKVLGPRRLMPSPKSNTVITDYVEGIKGFKAGTSVELRTDRNSLVQCACGKLSFGREKLIDNFKAVLANTAEKRPTGAPEDFWKNVHIGSTMSPSIKIDPKEFPVIQIKKEDDD